jgi:hypothetical protein
MSSILIPGSNFHKIRRGIYNMTLKKSVNFSLSKEKAKNIHQSIEYLLEIKGILRKFIPDFTDFGDDMIPIIKNLKKTAKRLIPIFEELNLITPGTVSTPVSKDSSTENLLSGKDASTQLIDNGLTLTEIVGENYLFISSNSIRKKLKSVGIEAFKIIAAGGPIAIEDLKKLNPNIPEAGLKGYQKKIDNVYKSLKKAVDSGLDLYFVMDTRDESDVLIADRLEEIESNIDKKFKRLYVMWDKI